MNAPTKEQHVSVPKRKLIEVALPLDAINRESAREKSIRHGHPSTLHLWWARRPLAACRAVLFAQLVDDPSSRPDLFPTEIEQNAKRKELFELIEKLIVWDNINDAQLYARARAEIMASTEGNPPAIFDPFAGGGSIPLEAQRLGLEAHASDLNPVAVLINKALVEIPAKFAGRPPVSPDAAESRLGDWPRLTGMAEDVRRYGQWMRDEAQRRIGHLYPSATLQDGSDARVIAWIWARTVTCPNPACGADIPLVTTWWLSKKKNRPTWLQPVIDGKQINFKVRTDDAGPPNPTKRGRGAKFACLVCQDTTTDTYVKSEATAGRMGNRLLCVVAETDRRRVYLPVTDEHIKKADIARPDDVPDAPLANDPRNIWCVNYGLKTFADLFTNRQLVALATFSDLVGEARDRIEKDAIAAGQLVSGAATYADAVALYLAFVVDKAVDRNTTLCTWETGMDRLRGTFQRQALPMTWDFAEANMFGGAGGDFAVTLRSEVEVLEYLGHAKTSGFVEQRNAESTRVDNRVVATDPPYYDNIGYADLSDFFYVWLRRSLGAIYSDVTGTMLTPKSEELVATPYRFDGDRKRADEHFERGFVRTFTRIREGQDQNFPTTVFYAFKQTESDDAGIVSTGWETMLNGLIEAGLSVTATWPMRTELGTRSIGRGANALASSVVLACRPREVSPEVTTRRGFLNALKTELPDALKKLQQGSVAPVDLAQAAIGPGMAVFTRYAKVVEADGSDMTVRTALALINQALDEVLSEQEGDFDSDTRFCVKWFTQFGWDEVKYGHADQLARSTNTSVDGLVRGGIFWARAGKARLLGVDDLADAWDPVTDHRVSDWEVVLRLAKALKEESVEAAASLFAGASQRVDMDTAKELAYLLFNVCERKKWTESAILFNSVGTSWLDIEQGARQAAESRMTEQGAFDFDDTSDF
jgi:putative DNA methylase